MKNYLLLIVMFFFINITNSQKDCKGCKDYATLPRMPDFYIEKYDELEFDSQDFYFDKKSNVIEGKKITIRYRHIKSLEKDYVFPTRLQILRNYSNAITRAGGKILFERSNSEYGNYHFTANNKKVWIKIRPVSRGNSYQIYIIEQQEMRQDLVIDAKLISEKLNLHGKIELKGIFFDQGKATIKKDSELAIIELAKYLKVHPEVNCWVVGHTSSEGSFEVNSALSLQRAQAIKSKLEREHNITVGRLFAEGVGPLAPVVSNNTEEGRKTNRRVELVIK